MHNIRQVDAGGSMENLALRMCVGVFAASRAGMCEAKTRHSASGRMSEQV